jgi:hypothetical protein
MMEIGQMSFSKFETCIGDEANDIRVIAKPQKDNLQCIKCAMYEMNLLRVGMKCKQENNCLCGGFGMHILRKPNIFECRSIVLMLFGCSSS